MIEARHFVEAARGRGFEWYAGVPCSYLTPFINYVLQDPGLRYVSMANEGDAVALIAGVALAGEDASLPRERVAGEALAVAGERGAGRDPIERDPASRGGASGVGGVAAGVADGGGVAPSSVRHRRGVSMMQNSGLGNAVSPLTSLTWTFRLPQLLIVTWRGQPGVPDEPQHALMGPITPSMLDTMEIRWELFPTEADAIGPALDRATAHMDATGRPYALLMQKGSVASYPLKPGAAMIGKRRPASQASAAALPGGTSSSAGGAAGAEAALTGATPSSTGGAATAEAALTGGTPSSAGSAAGAGAESAGAATSSAAILEPHRVDAAARPSRQEALREVVAHTPTGSTVVLASTGFCGRELYAVDDRPNHLYMVGSMGCVVPLALGLALARPDLRVVALDGDGAALMRMGAFATVGAYGPPNLQHLLLDNGAHDSTGGQATVSAHTSFAEIAAACGYASSLETDDVGRVASWLDAPAIDGPRFARLLTRTGTPDNLPRPSITPVDVKTRLMQHFGPHTGVR